MTQYEEFKNRTSLLYIYIYVCVYVYIFNETTFGIQQRTATTKLQEIVLE